MNKERRKAIADALDQIQSARAILETARDEEQDYYDNMPESLQGGEKGQAAEEAVSKLAEAIGSLESAESELEVM